MLDNQIILRNFIDSNSDYTIRYDSSVDANGDFKTVEKIYNAFIDYAKNNPAKIQSMENELGDTKLRYDIEKVDEAKDILNIRTSGISNSDITDKKVYKYLKGLISHYSVFEAIEGGLDDQPVIDTDNFVKLEIEPYSSQMGDMYAYKMASNSKILNVFNIIAWNTRISLVDSDSSERLSDVMEAGYFKDSKTNTTYYPFAIQKDMEESLSTVYSQNFRIMLDGGSTLLTGISVSGDSVSLVKFNITLPGNNSLYKIVNDKLINVLENIETPNKIGSGICPLFDESGSTVTLPYKNNEFLKYYENKLKEAINGLVDDIYSEGESMTKEDRKALINALDDNKGGGFGSGKLDNIISGQLSSNAKLKGYYDKIYKSGKVIWTEWTWKAAGNGQLEWESKKVSQTYSDFAKKNEYSISKGDGRKKQSLFLEDYINNTDTSEANGEFFAYFIVSACYTFNETNDGSAYNNYTFSRGYTIRNTSSSSGTYISPVYINSTNIVEGCNNDTAAITKIYEELWNLLKNIINKKLLETANKLRQLDNDEQTSGQSIQDASEAYDKYVSNRLANSVDESAFFYINTISPKKHVPDTPFVDIQFKIPRLSSKENEENHGWVSVTNVHGPSVDVMEGISEANIEGNIYHVESGSYFDSFTLTDSADGAKEIELTLKSLDDFNLEKIIMNSLSLTNGSYSRISANMTQSNQSGADINYQYIKSILENANSHFRVRFGYRNMANTEYAVNVVDTEDKSNNDFVNRDKYTDDKNADGKNIYKPTISYPWTNFMIKDMSSELIGDNITYKIKGQEVGQYMLDDLSLAGIGANLNFSETSDDAARTGKPKNVLGTIAQYFEQASDSWNIEKENTPAVYILGEDEKTIVTAYNWDNGGSFTTKRFELAEANKQIDGLFSDLDFEETFYPGKSGETIKSRNFNIATDSNYSLVSLRTLLDKLVNWLPERIYVLKRAGGENGEIFASRVPYSDLSDNDMSLGTFLNTNTHTIEKPKYQTIELQIKLDGEKVVRNAILVKFYFAGPKFREDTQKADGKEPIRVYSYKSGQNTVIKNISFENSLTFSKAVSAINMLGDGVPLVFINKNSDMKASPEPITMDDKNVYFSSSQIKKINNAPTSDIASDDENGAYKNALMMSASNYFREMKNMSQTGTITIMGDPFYYFDSTVEPANYEIYLKVNRIDDIISARHVSSYYSGIYKVDKITHSFSSEGNFETTLNIHKAII